MLAAAALLLLSDQQYIEAIPMDTYSILRWSVQHSVDIDRILAAMPHATADTSEALLLRIMRDPSFASECSFELRECLATYAREVLKKNESADNTALFASVVLVIAALHSEDDVGYSSAWCALIHVASTADVDVLGHLVAFAHVVHSDVSRDEWQMPVRVACATLDVLNAIMHLKSLSAELKQVCRVLACPHWASASPSPSSTSEWRACLDAFKQASEIELDQAVHLLFADSDKGHRR